MPKFTGDETPTDVMRLALNYFSNSTIPDKYGAAIIYQGGIPFLEYQATVKNNWGDFAVLYRLDKMLLNVFPVCQAIYSEVDSDGLFGESADGGKGGKGVICALAFHAMTTMLTRLLLLQLVLFEENFNETMTLTASTLFSVVAEAHKEAGNEAVVRVVNESVKTMIQATVDATAKQRRELQVILINALPTLNIPTSAGRPKGSKKPEDVKAQEAAEYEKKVEAAIRKLSSPKGTMPSKRAVAKELGIGGLSAGGTDSSLTNFSRKLKGLKIDYDAIVERVKVGK